MHLIQKSHYRGMSRRVQNEYYRRQTSVLLLFYWQKYFIDIPHAAKMKGIQVP